VLGVPPAQLESPGFDTLTRLLTQPGEQAQELQQALLSVLNTPDAAASAAAADVAVGVVDQVAQNMAARAGLDVDTLFPMRRFMLQTFSRGAGASQLSSSSSSAFSTVSSSVSSSSGSSSDADGFDGSRSSMPEPAAATHSYSGNGSSNGSSNGSAEPVLQEAAQLALAAASTGGAGGSVSKSNGKVLRMRQL
jgi:hypothetical protein